MSDSQVKEKDEKQIDTYKEPSFFRKFIYDLVLWILSVVFDCFFREIRPRGAFRLPKNGPVIFVGAPHSNQFVDPIVLMGQVKKEANLRLSFLIAEKSHRRKFIGLISRSQMAIPVMRAQDNLVSKKGIIKLDPNDELKIIGENTFFTKDCQSRGLISLPKSLGTAEINSIESDTVLLLKKPFRFSSPKVEEEAKSLLLKGTNYKAADRVDQSQVYQNVFQHLAHGHCIGIFPEGGSHDRPDLLPLKAGVAIMALGAMAENPGCNVKIVPCGMNYFHPHKFRSRAIVEFGKAIEIDKNLVEKYSNPETSKEAIRELLDIVTKGLKSVTVTCPDYESLICVQMARRLYANNISSQLSLSSVVEMNRRLVNGYLHFKDEPRMIELKKNILNYNENLKHFKIPDHLVDQHELHKQSQIHIFIEFLTNVCQLLIIGILSLPGICLFSPVFIATKKISDKKRKEALAGSVVKIKANDVIATWKILVSLGLAPVLYTFYSILGTFILKKWYNLQYSKFTIFIVFYLFSVSITYSTLIIGDKGMDLLKSIRPLWLSLVHKKGFRDLQEERSRLTSQITEVVNELGPQLYPDFNLFELEQKQNLKKLRQQERKKRRQQKKLDGLDSSDEEEEYKTQEMRNRRMLRKQKNASAAAAATAAAAASTTGSGIKDFSNVPIFSNDNDSLGGSSAGITSSSENELGYSSSSYSDVDSEGEENKKSELSNLIRDQIVKEHRQKESSVYDEKD